MRVLTATSNVRYGLLARCAVCVVVLGGTVVNARATVTDTVRCQSGRSCAVGARTIHLKETADLHLVAHQGTKILHEEGQVSGTLRGLLIAVIDIGYTQATVTFTVQSSSGTLLGHGVESYYVSGKNGHFSGRMAVTGGTGKYAHSVGSSLQTTGLIKRAHYEVLMTVSGLLNV
jgi:hypothetical protein